MTTGTHIGDGVYADFDGWNIWLRTGDGNNNEIAIEPETWTALLTFMSETRASYLRPQGTGRLCSHVSDAAGAAMTPSTTIEELVGRVEAATGPDHSEARDD